MHKLKCTQRTSEDTHLKISSVQLCTCAYVRANITCIGIDINFNKEFTFQIESGSSLKSVHPQTTFSSPSVKHVRKCKPLNKL